MVYHDSRSWQTLRRLLAPLLVRWVRRRSRERAAARLAAHVTLPSVDVVKRHPFFASWPVSVLQRLLDDGAVECYEAGSAVAFTGEPVRCVAVYWVLSGKLTQLPTKQELAACASHDPRFAHSTHDEALMGESTSSSKQPRTGPHLLPRLFAESDKASVAVASAPLNSQQETLLDLLQVYTTGQMVDLEPLVLGDVRHRALRAQTPVALLAFPLRTLQLRMDALTSAQRVAALQRAVDAVTTRLVHCDARPTALLLQNVNPVLKGLSHSTLHAMWLQLEPHVFTAGAVVCPDEYTAEVIYFLHSGCTTTSHGEPRERVMRDKDSAVGLHSIAVAQFPRHCGGHAVPRGVRALTYCELWGIPAHKLLRLCTDAELLQCARLATTAVQQQLQTPSFARTLAPQLLPSLRRVSVFGYLSDATLRVIADALAARVYAPGECIVPAKRTVRCGVVCVTGKACVLSRRRPHDAALQDTDEEMVQCGQPLFFAEALAGVHPPGALYARTSVLVQQCVPGVMLDALEEQLCSPDEVRVMLDETEKYVLAQYGSDRVAYMRGQASSLQRVRAYRARMRQTPPRLPPTPPNVPDVLEVQNELYTCLSLQLQTLHVDPIEIDRCLYLRGEHGATATLTPECHPSELPPAAAAAVTPPPVCGFTVNARGEVCVAGVGEVDTTPPATTPRPPVRTPHTARGGTLTPLARPPTPLATCKPPREPRPHQLFVPPVPPPHMLAAPRSRQRPHRLAAINRAVTELKDQTTGFNAQAEYRQMLLRQRCRA